MVVRTSLVPPLVAILLGIFSSASTSAKDVLLTIGGGYEPTGNQQSLERNVIFQQAVVAEQRPDKPQSDVYFADGTDENRDVQCRDPKFEENCPTARRMMAEIFGDADSKDLYYRNHEVPNQRGPAQKSTVRERMQEIARDLQAGDRLIVYLTGHGGPAQTRRGGRRNRQPSGEANQYNTTFYVWDNDAVTASEFAGWLDGLNRDVQVMMVMVQCYAGGFSHTIFQQADAKRGLSPNARCGFFAQVHDRGAAGCTADANESDYEEYSSYFWGALGGRARTGEPITTADYNGDGKVSFAEAHSYAVLESDTIDIPVRTTDALLRTYSHVGTGPSDPVVGNKTIVELKGPIAGLAAQARPDQRAILDRLPARLGLKQNATIADIRQQLEQVKTDTRDARRKLSSAERSHARLLDSIQTELREVWPELNATYAPLAMELTSDRAKEFTERVSAMESYQKMQRAAERLQVASEEYLALSRKEARLQRLLHTGESVALGLNLPMTASAEIAARYRQLLAMEEDTFVP